MFVKQLGRQSLAPPSAPTFSRSRPDKSSLNRGHSFPSHLFIPVCHRLLRKDLRWYFNWVWNWLFKDGSCRRESRSGWIEDRWTFATAGWKLFQSWKTTRLLQINHSRMPVCLDGHYVDWNVLLSLRHLHGNYCTNWSQSKHDIGSDHVDQCVLGVRSTPSRCAVDANSCIGWALALFYFSSQKPLIIAFSF